jgi:hypothetical protein
VAHYQPRHTSNEVVGSGRRRPRRSVIIGGGLAGAVIVAAAVAVPLMVSGGGGGGPTATGQAASVTKTSGSTPSTGTSSAGTSSTGTTAATVTSTGADNGVSTRGAGAAALGGTSSTTAPTTTTRPQISPAASTSPATNVAAPDGFGPVAEALWAGADPGGVHMSLADVASVLPGSVFYAEQPAIGTFWAISRFVPSSQAQGESGTAAGNALLAQFNKTAMFVKVPGKPWVYLGEYTTTACGQAVPTPVLNSWGMCS